MTDSDSYNRLREWYLARLRNLARQQESKTAITPASLIASDKMVIEQLIAKAADKSEAPEEKRIPLFVLPAIWLFCQLIAILYLCVSMGDLQKAFLQYASCCLNPLISFNSHGWFGDMSERVCFATFYGMPLLLLTFFPSRNFALKADGSPQIPAKRFLEGISSSAGLQRFATFLLVALLILFARLFLFTPAEEASDLVMAPSLVPMQIEPAIASFLAWLCLALSLFLYALKINLAKLEADSSQLKALCKETNISESSDIAGCVEGLENVIKELTQKEQAIADYSRTIICSFDKDMVVQSISPSSFIHWGYAIYELLGQDLRSIIFNEDIAEFHEAVQKIAESGSSAEIECRIRRKDNIIVDCLWYVDWSAQLNSFFTSCDDITDKKNLERARRTFMAQLTHDMRSPLSSIELSMSAIQEGVFGEVSEAITKTVGRAQSSLSRVLGLINDILEGEQLRAGRMQMEKELFGARSLCEEVLAELKPVAVKREVKLEIDGPDLQIRASRKRIARVISNLVSNAISFSPTNAAVKIQITDSSNSALVKIIDNGPGVPKDYQKLIFERFSGAKSNGPKDRVSTGIGLSICRDIITAHGGMVGLTSEPGNGSIFWFSLPMERKSTMEVHKARAREEKT